MTDIFSLQPAATDPQGDTLTLGGYAQQAYLEYALSVVKGRALPDVLAHLGHVAEGVYSAATVAQRAQALGVDMPLTTAVNAVLQGQLTPRQAVERLMQRDARAEKP